MTRRRKTQITVVLVAVLGGMAWLIVHTPAEPSYEGKPLSYWLAEYRNPRKPRVTEQLSIKEVDNAIRHIGTNAIPILIQMLKSQDSGTKAKLIDFLNRQHVINIHITTASERRIMAMQAFGTLGADARSAVPDLAKMFADAKPPERFDIGESLWRILPSRGLEFNLNMSERAYEFSQNDLLKALGPPTILHEDWAAYDMGTFGSIGRAYLCIGFVRGRVIYSTVTFGLTTNTQSPFIAPGLLLR